MIKENIDDMFEDSNNKKEDEDINDSDSENQNIDLQNIDDFIKKVEYTTAEGDKIDEFDDINLDLDSSVEVVKDITETDKFTPESQPLASSTTEENICKTQLVEARSSKLVTELYPKSRN
ncbi:hypothetical protein L1987_08818 [Smallanthus sonchifolius]|uniref:Uncharacterized protein n=1 Tax=Smallanthus sonchifolius TaxID=185202 RepID=A0ACB9JNV3_9ASTR|nr:hypothetical protein L1987_08818 [Smallanthus sonchifolius]